jgi:hypothetical protein
LPKALRRRPKLGFEDVALTQHPYPWGNATVTAYITRRCETNVADVASASLLKGNTDVPPVQADHEGREANLSAECQRSGGVMKFSRVGGSSWE